MTQEHDRGEATHLKIEKPKFQADFGVCCFGFAVLFLTVG